MSENINADDLCLQLETLSCEPIQGEMASGIRPWPKQSGNGFSGQMNFSGVPETELLRSLQEAARQIYDSTAGMPTHVVLSSEVYAALETDHEEDCDCDTCMPPCTPEQQKLIAEAHAADAARSRAIYFTPRYKPDYSKYREPAHRMHGMSG